MLEQLEQRNMLIVPLDDQRQWYRYHNLFADILRTYLVTTYPERVPVLHQRASHWYEQNGWQSEAIQHALVIEDYGRAADLIEMTWPALFNDYRPATLLGWIKALPEDIVRNRPVLNLGGTWTLLRAGDMEGAEGHLQDAERWFDSDTAESSELVITNRQASRTLSEYIITARIYLSQAQGDWTRAVDYCRRLFELTTEDQYYARGIAEFLAGFSHWAIGDLTVAYQT
ncbi:helix-turn-helix transcriptional regulator, partial [Candidatus Woesebacteria bacterium]|nr:helix-turn-helix transcriptional regulator [Candidatus Woesebacteria bacterium]